MQPVPNSEISIRACPTCGRQYRAADEQNERCTFDGSTTIVVHADRLLNQIASERYRIVALIGVGAWSEVYKALDVHTGSPFAVKVLHSHLSADPLNVARFKREADVLLQLRHRCFAAIYEQGVIDGNRPCLVMEYLVGLSLDNYLSSVGRLTLSQGLELFLPVCDALAGAHEKGLLHRDLKPSNIFLVEKDGVLNPKILDFGLAKMFLLGTGGAMASLTQSGEILGTPAYMSPEQCQGNVLDQRSDLYALGCMIYEGLTNKKAVPGKTAFEAMSNQIGRVPDPMREACPEALVPEEAEALIFQLLEKDPDDRFGDAREFAAAFNSAIELAKTHAPNAASAAPQRTVNGGGSGESSRRPHFSTGGHLSKEENSERSSTYNPISTNAPIGAKSSAAGGSTSSPTAGAIISATAGLRHGRNIQHSAAVSQSLRIQQSASLIKQLTNPVMITLLLVGLLAAGGLIWFLSGMVDTVIVTPPAVNDADNLLDLSHSIGSSTNKLTTTNDFNLRQTLTLQPQTKELDLSRKRFSQSGLRVLSQAKSLERLKLRECPDVDDQTIANLGPLNIVSLDLSGTRISGAGLKSLRAMKNLRSLELSSTAVSDQDCVLLASLPLNDVNLSSTQITALGLKNLSASKTLKWLFLDDTKLGDDLSALNPLNLIWLTLKHTDFNDHALASLKLPMLEQLAIDDTKITDAGLLTIAHRKALKFLWINQCLDLTPSGVDRLRAAVAAEHRGPITINNGGVKTNALERAKNTEKVIDSI